MRRADMRKLYVCEIVKQVTVGSDSEMNQNDTRVDLTNNAWSYERNSKYGLFLKTVGGYKRITFGVTYKLPSSETVGEEVVDPESVEEFVKAEKKLAEFFFNRNKSYSLDFIEAAYIEHRINEERQLQMQE